MEREHERPLSWENEASKYGFPPHTPKEVIDRAKERSAEAEARALKERSEELRNELSESGVDPRDATWEDITRVSGAIPERFLPPKKK